MRYHWFRQCGLFAGSGVVETSCKSASASSSPACTGPSPAPTPSPRSTVSRPAAPKTRSGPCATTRRQPPDRPHPGPALRRQQATGKSPTKLTRTSRRPAGLLAKWLMRTLRHQTRWPGTDRVAYGNAPPSCGRPAPDGALPLAEYRQVSAQIYLACTFGGLGPGLARARENAACGQCLHGCAGRGCWMGRVP
jgi:hypothetical protein